jgi:transcriptional regulator with XRE-family HTH domain
MHTGGESLTFEQQVILSLKGFRKNKKITQTQLADSIGVSRDTIARMESGRARVYLGMVKDIADALDVLLQDLIQEEGNSQDVPENVSPSRPDIYVEYSNKDVSLRADSPVGEEAKQSPSNAPNPTRNPYLDEKAVDSYGEPMKSYIINHRLFWHWVPLEDLPGLSISSVVEATLNQGREEDVKWLFDTIGVEKAADVFKRGISGFRTNYRDEVISYFHAYFTRHVPKSYL